MHKAFQSSLQKVVSRDHMTGQPPALPPPRAPPPGPPQEALPLLQKYQIDLLLLRMAHLQLVTQQHQHLQLLTKPRQSSKH